MTKIEYTTGFNLKPFGDLQVGQLFKFEGTTTWQLKIGPNARLNLKTLETPYVSDTKQVVTLWVNKKEEIRVYGKGD